MRRLSLSLLLSCGLAAPGEAAAPSHFGVEIGHAILCLNHLDPGYFYNYLVQHFRPPYKQSDGAYWFRVEAQLWTAKISEVFVSDGSSNYVFIGAITPSSPPELAKAIAQDAKVGVVFREVDPAWSFTPYQANTGSEIAHQGDNTKIFCKGSDTSVKLKR